MTMGIAVTKAADEVASKFYRIGSGSSDSEPLSTMHWHLRRVFGLPTNDE